MNPPVLLRAKILSACFSVGQQMPLDVLPKPKEPAKSEPYTQAEENQERPNEVEPPFILSLS
jgi:hypothetical protein